MLPGLPAEALGDALIQREGKLLAAVPFYTTVIAPVAAVSVGWLSAVLYVRASLRGKATMA